MSLRKDLQDLLNEARAAGFDVPDKPERSGHYRITPPGGGKKITCPCTPSDWRTLLNLRAQLRREGLPR